MNIALCISEKYEDNEDKKKLIKRLINEVFLILKETEVEQMIETLTSVMVTIIGNCAQNYKENAMREVCRILMETINRFEFETEEENENI